LQSPPALVQPSWSRSSSPSSIDPSQSSSWPFGCSSAAGEAVGVVRAHTHRVAPVRYTVAVAVVGGEVPQVSIKRQVARLLCPTSVEERRAVRHQDDPFLDRDERLTADALDELDGRPAEREIVGICIFDTNDAAHQRIGRGHHVALPAAHRVERGGLQVLARPRPPAALFNGVILPGEKPVPSPTSTS